MRRAQMHAAKYFHAARGTTRAARPPSLSMNCALRRRVGNQSASRIKIALTGYLARVTVALLGELYSASRIAAQFSQQKRT